jgi:hypothetical protein
MNAPQQTLSPMDPTKESSMFSKWETFKDIPKYVETAPSRSSLSLPDVNEGSNKYHGNNCKNGSSSNNKQSSASCNKPMKSSIKDERLLAHRHLKQQRNHLAFADCDTVFPIPHINEMSEQEINDCWMSAEDLQAIRQSCIGTVREMNNNKNNNGEPPEGIFLRGLDQHSDKYKQRKDEINNQVYDAVFRIQEFQRLSGKDASGVIAKLCAKYSEPSVIAAHTAAISDIFSAHKGLWSQRAIPDASVFADNPKGQGTYNY